MSDTKKLYRMLPSVDSVLERLAEEPDLAARPRPLLKDLVTETLDDMRDAIRSGAVAEGELDAETLLSKIVDSVGRRSRPHFRRVVNATGVVIHTNLGRSLLANEAVDAVAEACARYSNLEFDLEAGKRGSRYSHVEEILKRVTGAEAGLVVNNNAAAVLLVLDTLCKGGEVVVSRGELVEIGGSFRIPEVMEKSGAFLREVGATNRTHLSDYENAITEETKALLKVHASNYRIIGFTKEVSIPELRRIAQPRGLPVIEDLGSGNLFDFAPFAFGYEPTVQEKVAQGADIITFSGDKVLGGPQAGIIVGRAEYVERIKKNPMNRALRIDKMTLAALEATLQLYMDPELARRKVPTIAMMTAGPDELRKKAYRLARRLRRSLGERAAISLAPGASRVGGGSFPERDLETTLVRVVPSAGGPSLATLRDRLLAGDPPLVGRIEDDGFCLDPRTLAEDELPLAAELLATAFGVPKE
ncbi:MAG: L-seryl-tRNA(Sec) selenium transferase [Oceanidesulfovibrio sp.]